VRIPARPLAFAALGLLLLASCSGATSTSGPGVTSATAAPGTGVATTAPPECDGAGELAEDDDAAESALIGARDLPPGTWTETPESPCALAISGDALLREDECVRAASASSAPPDGKPRNGYAWETWSNEEGTQLDHRVEVYTSRQNVDAIHAALTSRDRASCLEAALRRVVETRPGSQVGGFLSTLTWVNEPSTAGVDPSQPLAGVQAGIERVT
jgi:hypothetical protein